MKIVHDGGKRFQSTPEVKQKVADLKQSIKMLRAERKTATPLRRRDIDAEIARRRQEIEALSPSKALW